MDLEAEQQQALGSLFQRMPMPRFIIKRATEAADKDDFYVTHANDLALQYFGVGEDGYSREGIVGRTIQDFMDTENVGRFHKFFESAYDQRQSTTIDLPRPVFSRSEERVSLQVQIHGFIASPVFDENGVVEYLDVIARLDKVSHVDRSLLKQERDEALLLLTSIFEVSEIGVIITDHKGKVIRINQSFIRTYGWSRDELLGVEFVSLVTPDERDIARDNHDNFIGTGGHSAGEVKIIRKDGGVANVLFTSAVMELSQKRRFLVTTVMDITLRKQMEESLRYAKDEADSSNRAKSTFLANMSHELRTPLNAIIGFTEMIVNETFGPIGNDKYKEYLQDVHGSAKHLLSIINEVLDMSKIEAGRIELDESDIPVADLIQDVMRMIASRDTSSHITFEKDIEPDLPYLFADRRLLKQVLINLLGNAIKFSNEKGKINLRARLLDNGSIQIAVEDQGIGIPKDKLQKALEPFGQVYDQPDNANQQGTGLGLPLAKAMVEMHGATFEIESKEGIGTSVLITFPEHRSSKKDAGASEAIKRAQTALAEQRKDN